MKMDKKSSGTTGAKFGEKMEKKEEQVIVSCSG